MKFIFYILALIMVFSFSGCVKGVNTEVIQQSEYAYLRFTGNLDSISVNIDEGTYFDLSDYKQNTGAYAHYSYHKDAPENLYKIDKGKHRIQVFRNNELIIDKLIFIANHSTSEINIP